MVTTCTSLLSSDYVWSPLGSPMAVRKINVSDHSHPEFSNVYYYDTLREWDCMQGN